VAGKLKQSKAQVASLQTYESCDTQELSDRRVEALVTELIGRVADK
jgi:hypothetical protein